VRNLGCYVTIHFVRCEGHMLLYVRRLGIQNLGGETSWKAITLNNKIEMSKGKDKVVPVLN